MDNNIAVAIDIGTTKIYVIIAKVDSETQTFQVKGYGVAASRGLKRGLIVDITTLSEDIERAVKKAELMSGIKVTKAFVGLSGKHIKSSVTNVELELDNAPRVIEEKDYERLVQKAINRLVEDGRQVLHEIVYNYKVDNSSVLKNAIGMQGSFLKADVHLITGSEKEIISLKNALKNINIEIDNIILEPYASAKSVLTQSEKEFGTVIVDIGGGTTDLGIYKRDKLIYASVIPIGGQYFTSDIAQILKIDLETAEELKKTFSDLYIDSKTEKSLQVDSKNSNDKIEVKLDVLKEIIEARIDDIIEYIEEGIELSGFGDYITNGIVFTGGSSKIAGLEKRAKQLLNYNIKIGVPIEIDGLLENMNKPENATGIGLLLYATEKIYYYSKLNKEKTYEKKVEKKEKSNENLEKDNKITEKFKKFFSSLF
ncbi:MAG: cell division protein FtsA [Fusobacteriaceae bacterium]|jgi:cell division protein FtsA|nr:cell division protein FtsA [Fusobacteriaceae bacterium]